jgi:hypothetical protein
MSSRRARRARRQPNQANPSAENSPRAARIDALLDQVRKIDLFSIEDERTRAIAGLLLNVVEDLRGELRKAHQEDAYLRERSGMSRGGGGKPDGQPEVYQLWPTPRRKSGTSQVSEAEPDRNR